MEDVRGAAAPKGYAFFGYWNKVFDIFSGVTTSLMFITVIIQISGRLSAHPAPWTEEATRFVFIWMIFLGVGIGFRRGESARVTYFLNWMPKVVRKCSTFIYMVVTIAFFIFMFYTGSQIVMQQLSMHEMGSALMIPMWIIGISLPVSAVIGILGVIESAIFHKELI
jgi:C4-dicarboxylate transporter DctQ subunit